MRSYLDPTLINLHSANYMVIYICPPINLFNSPAYLTSAGRESTCQQRTPFREGDLASCFACIRKPRHLHNCTCTGPSAPTPHVSRARTGSPRRHISRGVATFQSRTPLLIKCFKKKKKKKKRDANRGILHIRQAECCRGLVGDKDSGDNQRCRCSGRPWYGSQPRRMSKPEWKHQLQRRKRSSSTDTQNQNFTKLFYHLKPCQPYSFTDLTPP